MHVVIAGGHGKIALRLASSLSARGDDVTGIIRNPAQVGDVAATGAQAVVVDLERCGLDAVAKALHGADAAVFAAGAGPGSGAARKDTVDRGASQLLADACERTGVRRFVQISSMGADRPPPADADEVWAAYITAKADAEEDLRRRDLDWTILRPGHLTDEPGTGRVTLARPPVSRGDVPRQDVAEVIATLLSAPATAGLTLELVAGSTPIVEAVRVLDGHHSSQ